jgi:hypothetical protein
MRAPHIAENASLAFEVRRLPANNCLKTPAYANLMQILGYPPSINASSHFAAEPGIFYKRERTAKVIPNYQY